MEIKLEDSVWVSEDVVFRELDSEAVLLNLETGIYFGLNKTGTRVWNLLGQHRSLQTVLETVTQEYQLPPSSLGNDILRFASQLCEKGLVCISLKEKGRVGQTP